MNYVGKILFQSFVKPFYKENAGLFIFIFTMMFFIVSRLNGAGLFDYHYSLAAGMLKNNIFLILVLFAWLVYARKFVVFLSGVILNPQYAFLQVYNQLSKAKRFKLFFIVEAWLLLPVLVYIPFVSFVGLQQHLYQPLLFIIVYLFMLCIFTAVWHVYLLNNPNRKKIFSINNLITRLSVSSSYQFILLRFIAIKQKTIWAGIKLFTCGVLYLIARNNTPASYDINMPFLFFNLGILANGVLIYRVREFEEIYLNFYRSLPVSLMKRFAQYAFIYFILFVPEMFTVLILVPIHLYYSDGINFILCGFSLLLLMNSLTFYEDFKMRDYLKILLILFFVECIFLLTVGMGFLYLTLFILAATIFLSRYYKFERGSS